MLQKTIKSLTKLCNLLLDPKLSENQQFQLSDIDIGIDNQNLSQDQHKQEQDLSQTLDTTLKTLSQFRHKVQTQKQSIKLCKKIMELKLEQPADSDNQIREKCLNISPINNWNLNHNLNSIDHIFTSLAGLKKKIDQTQQMMSNLFLSMKNNPFVRHCRQLDELFVPLTQQIQNSMPVYQSIWIIQQIDKIKQYFTQFYRGQDFHIQIYHTLLQKLEVSISDILNKKNILKHQENQNMRIKVLALHKFVEENISLLISKQSLFKKTKQQNHSHYQDSISDILSIPNLNNEKRKRSLEIQRIKFVKGIQLKNTNKYRSEGESLRCQPRQTYIKNISQSSVKQSYRSSQQNYVYV